MEAAAPTAPVSAPGGHRVGRAAAAVLLAGSAALHLAAMFPDYYTSPARASLASQTDQAALYAVLAALWALSLVMLLARPGWRAPGAAWAAGLAATELGFRVADLGEVFRYGTGTAGPGLWLMTAAWAVGAVGALVAVLSARRSGAGDPAGEPTVPPPFSPAAVTALVAVLALATAGAFLPAWDRYHGLSSATGRSISFSLGNAFSQPWQVVLGSVLVAVALLAVPVVASRLRDRAAGAAATAGAVLVLATQFVAAVVQVDQPVSPALAGLSDAQARQLGLALSLKLTGWFTVDALAALALFVVVMVNATARVEAD